MTMPARCLKLQCGVADISLRQGVFDMRLHHHVEQVERDGENKDTVQRREFAHVPMVMMSMMMIMMVFV